MNQLAEDIKKGEFKQLYLIYGEEEYFYKLYKNELLKALGALEDTMNFTRFEGKQCSEEKIIENCETMPFFSERRIVLVEESGFLKEKKEKLSAYVEKLPDYLVLIFAEKEIDKRNKLYKNIVKYERVIECKTLDAKSISSWVLMELKRNKKRIKKDALDHFLAGAGTNLNFISCEIEKLISYLGERSEITVEDINQICTVQIENKIFEMIADAAAGKREKALKGYYDLLLLKEPPMRILFLIERQFDQLLRVKELSMQGMGEKLIAEKLKIHPYAVKKNMPLARKYSIEELRNAVEDYLSAEQDVKTGKLVDKLSVELMLVKHSKL